MTLPSTLRSGRRMLDRVAAPIIAAGLPLAVVDLVDRRNARDIDVTIDDSPGSTVVRLVRNAHVTEGMSSHGINVDLYALSPAEAEAAMTEFLYVAENLLRDDAAIIAQGGDPERAPARWFTCHPFLLAAAGHWGWPADHLVLPTTVHCDGAEMVVRNDDAMLTPLLTASTAGATVHCARTMRRRHVSCAHLSVHGPDGRAILAQYSDDGRPAVRIPGKSIPDTVLMAVEGRTVSAVVDDERLGPMRDLRIVEAVNTGNGVTLIVEDGAVRMDEGGKA